MIKVLPALPGVIAAAIVTVMRVWLASLIGRVLLAAGVGLFAYNYALPELMRFVGGQFRSLPDFVRQSVGMSGIDVMATMVISALSVKATAKVFFGRLGD